MAVSTGFKQQCPSCEAMVPIKDISQVGKKIDCPKCKYRFVVEAAAGADAGDDDEKPASKAPAKSPAKSSKGKPLPRRDENDDEDDEPARKKKSGNTMLLVGGGLGGLTVVLLAVAYFTGMFGSDTKTPTKPNTSSVATSNRGTPSTTAPGGDGTTPGNPVEAAPSVPSGSNRDATNLLPEETQLVVNLNMDRFYTSPVGSRLFSPETKTRQFVQQFLGIAVENIKSVVVAANAVDGWSFTVVKTGAPLQAQTVLTAMGADKAGKVEKKRSYYLVRNNPLIDTLGAYFQDTVNEALDEPALRLFKGDPERKLAIHLLDSNTLVLADESVMIAFLRKDTMPNQRSILSGGAEADPTAPPPVDAGAEKAAAKSNNKGQVFTTNPSFLTIDPAIKSILNRMDDSHKTSIVQAAFRMTPVFKIPNLFGLGGIIGRAIQIHNILGFGFGLGDPSKTPPVVGLVVKELDAKHLTFDALFDINLKDEEVTKLAATLNEQAKSVILRIIESEFGIKLVDPNNPAGGLGMPGTRLPGREGGDKTGLMQGRPKPGGEGAPGASPPAAPGAAPGSEPEPNGTKAEFTANGRVITLAVEVDWSRNIFDSRIAAILDGKVDQQRSKAVLLAQRAHWTSLRKPLEGFQKEGFPQGAYPRKTNTERFMLPYPAEQRISWLAELLPGLGYDTLYRELYKDLSWNHPSNLKYAIRWIPEFLSPAQPPHTWRAELPSVRNQQLGATHFIGLSGIGLDSAEMLDTPENAKKLGIIGYDRRTKFEDIQKNDGASNTIFMLQVSPNIPRPWIRGGGTTVQGVPETDSMAPFRVLQPDNRFGNYALMADGSIRFIASNISDEVFKAMVTYKGGEKLGDIDTVAAKEDPQAIEVKATQRNMTSNGSVLHGVWQQLDIPEAYLKVRIPGTAVNDQTKDVLGFVVDSKYYCPDKQNPIYRILVSTPEKKPSYNSNSDADLDQLVQALEKRAMTPEKVQKYPVGPKNCRRFELQLARGRFVNLLFISAGKQVVLEVPAGTVKEADIDQFFKSVVTTEPKVKEGWQKLVVDQGGTKATVEMPGPPTQTSSAQDPFMKRFQHREAGVAYEAEIKSSGTEFPIDDFNGRKAEEYIDILKLKPGNEVYDVKPVTTDEQPGRQFKWRQTKKEKNKDTQDEKIKITNFIVRIYMFNNTMVSLTISYPENGNVNDADIKRFMDSIKLERPAK